MSASFADGPKPWLCLSCWHAATRLARPPFLQALASFESALLLLLFIFLYSSSMKIPPKANLRVLFMSKRFSFLVLMTIFASSVNLSPAHKVRLHPTAQKLAHTSVICSCMESEAQ